ncbi:MAG TPA: alpha/beta hydrolase [Thermoanaerobaculia bacterium]|nr:alpha/beta hydrolase [Thermoanaerobaculia bacterium]
MTQTRRRVAAIILARLRAATLPGGASRTGQPLDARRLGRRLALVLALAGAVSCVMVRPDRLDRHLPPEAPAGARLAERVGWYRVDGACVLLTFSAQGGLALVGPTEPLFFHRWRHQGGDRFLRELPGEGAAARAVTFGERSWAFAWRDATGSVVTAERCSGPYAVQEVAYQHAGARLRATLLVPSGGSAAGAVMVHGSGTSDRDNLWYLQIAHAMATQGIAVLFPDKRGSGESEGEWRTASFELLAGDAAAGIRALAESGSVAREAIGVVGLSQGGHIAPLIAAHEPVAWVVNLSGGAVTMAESLRHETVETLAQKGLPRPLARLLEPIASAVPKRRRPVWWELNGSWDPLPHWVGLRVPALVVYGAEDERDNVPVQRSVERLRSADRESLAPIRVEVFPGLGHGLFAADRRHLHPDVLELLTRWIRSQSP